jgi:hypothetical protein
MRHAEGMNPSPDPHAGSPNAGRWYLAALGLALALIGGFFTWLMWRSYDRARDMHTWPEVPCVILSAELERRPIDYQGPPEYRVKLLYGYEYQGTRRTGDRITWRGNPWSSKENLVEQRVTAYPEGRELSCRVNPEAPEFAVLEPDTMAPGYSIWFPLLFIVAGLTISFKAVTRRQAREISRA